MADTKLKVTVSEPVIKTTVRVTETVRTAKPFADGDNSIDARMWRLEQDHIRMGARPKP